MDYSQLAPTLQTGDIFLFHGTTWVSKVIDAITDSEYSHIGMVVREEGQTGPNGLYLWQSFEPEGGVVYDPLEPYLNKYIASELGASFVCRQLAVDRSAAMIAALDAYMPTVKGLGFPSFQQWIINWISGHLGIPSAQNTFFCSELVSQTFMKMGLLPPTPLDTTYAPANFQASNDAKLPLLLGASFGPEISVTMPQTSGLHLEALNALTNVPVDPVPLSAYPAFSRPARGTPQMDQGWTATVLLHPFSPPLPHDRKPDTPFFQLCVATIDCYQGQSINSQPFFSARIKGCDYGRWWYMIDSRGTRLSTDDGKSWTNVDMGWSLPTDWFGGQGAKAACAGSSPMNWMSPRSFDWWKVPVPLPGTTTQAATWMWFDSETGAPARMMFGNGPPTPEKGDPTQLALLQMFSFSYFAHYEAAGGAHGWAAPEQWQDPEIAGFAVGNPQGFKPFVWNTNFGMTTFMTPVNGAFDPLPTRLLYVWKPDEGYHLYTDRAQSTLMQYNFNTSQPTTPAITRVESLLTGHDPGPPTPNSGSGFLYTVFADGTSKCATGDDFPFAQEKPEWVSIPAAKGTIRATIVDNPALCPDQTITVYSVLFPAAEPNYPEATYVWAWYAPEPGSDGTNSRAVTFMQSQSGVNTGTSLALADYFYYQPYAKPIDPGNFAIPIVCLPG